MKKEYKIDLTYRFEDYPLTKSKCNYKFSIFSLPVAHGLHTNSNHHARAKKKNR